MGLRRSLLLSTIIFPSSGLKSFLAKNELSPEDQEWMRWDPALVNRSCLKGWMEETGTPLDKVCSDDSSNNIKDDRGNYIQFTRLEDRLMYNVWERSLLDCAKGESYVRDVVAAMAERTSCFVDETTLADEDYMYKPVKELQDGVIVMTNRTEKVICVGDSKTESRAKLDERLAKFRALVVQWDAAENGDGKLELCQEMLAAHTLYDYRWFGVFKTSRPAVCNSTAPWYDGDLCSALEKWYVEFRSRDLFTETEGSQKGRAAEGENKHSEMCLAEMLNGTKWSRHLTTNVGSTVDDPVKCTIDTERDVFPEPVLKVGVVRYSMADNMVADAFRFCGAPFVAGVSGTMPIYLISTAGGPTKAGQTKETALTVKEALVNMAMLELGGFHAVTGLSLSINHYFHKLLVTPPFDSGAFDGPGDGKIRCHDTATMCCTNSSKTAEGFYNHQAYLDMMQQWSDKVDELWG